MHRDEGYQIAYCRNTGYGQQDVWPWKDYRICLDNKMSGHLYESQPLLKEREGYADDKSCSQSAQWNHPSFQDEYIPDKSFFGSHASESLDVRSFLYDQHGQASENVEGNDDDDYENDEEDEDDDEYDDDEDDEDYDEDDDESDDE